MMVSNTWLAQLPIAPIDTATPVSGGDINEAYRITKAHRLIFCWFNRIVRQHFIGMKLRVSTCLVKPHWCPR